MKKQNKPAPLQPRLRAFRLKSEQAHKNVKAYDRKKTKKIIQKTIKMLISREKLD